MTDRAWHPLVFRWTAVGAMFGGVVGGIVGLVVGLIAYPPTAWFAVFEAGIPAAVVGGTVALVLSALVACVTWVVRVLSAARSRW